MSADAVISQLLLLDAQDPDQDIKLFINSPGGSVTAGDPSHKKRQSPILPPFAILHTPFCPVPDPRVFPPEQGHALSLLFLVTFKGNL